MKTGLVFFIILYISVFAGEKYGVYDLQGNRISTFEAKQHELPEKVRQVKESDPNRSLYISSLSKGNSSKSVSRYRYKAEAGAYIEASRKETFSVCPDKEIQGTWISEYSVALNSDNCISVQTSDIAGTISILFMQNNGRTDTIQVLVDQSYVQMGDYSHKIWVPDSLPSLCKIMSCDIIPYGHYESREYKQSLIVDKTKLTMGDAQYYSKIFDMPYSILFPQYYLKEYPKNEKLEESKYPYVGHYSSAAWRFANARSKEENLDTAYHRISKNSKEAKKFLLLGDPNKDYNACETCTMFALDTSASGYRLPFDEEWLFLMRAGASTRYYWGDEEDSLTVSRYEWVRPTGLKPVAQLPSNRFGLYDMLSITREVAIVHRVFDFNGKNYNYHDIGLSGGGKTHEFNFISKIRTLEQVNRIHNIQECRKPIDEPWQCVEAPKLVLKPANYDSFRLLRKTPKLHKLDKF